MMKLSIIIFLFCISCLGHNQKQKYTQSYQSVHLNADTVYSIWIVNHGWHTGIIIKTADISPSYFLSYPDFPENNFLEFGWGDKDFYQDGGMDIDYWLTIKAALWPTSSVVHVVGFDSPVEKYFSYSGLIMLSIPDTAFSTMLSFIDLASEKDSSGQAILIGKGLYGNSRFYEGEATYYFPKTCNVWTAQCLKEAGLPLYPLKFQRSAVLMEFISEYGKVIRRRED